MKNRNIVAQEYRLVNAKYKLTTAEMKFISLAMTQINKDNSDLKEYEIKVSELEHKLRAEQNETRLKQFAKKLLSKPLEVPTERGWMVANWFADIEYINGEARFLVTFSKKLKPYLLDFKERFVKYHIENVINLTSEYSIRIYQLLKEYEKLTKRTFTVVELQEMLQVPKSYKIYNRFKEKVLQVAERELIENCDIFFEYEEIKTNRKVTEILFRIKRNVKATAPSNRTSEEHISYDKYYGKTIEYKETLYENIIKITPDEDGFLNVLFNSSMHCKGHQTQEVTLRFENIKTIEKYLIN